MSRKKLLLVGALVALIVVFFAFDLGHYLSRRSSRASLNSRLFMPSDRSPSLPTSPSMSQ